MMTTQAHHVDHELIQAAAHVARTRCRGDNHTMAAAARARDDRIVSAVNAYHFTGGPCAELVVITGDCVCSAGGLYDGKQWIDAEAGDFLHVPEGAFTASVTSPANRPPC
jgi:hypothetical protein